MTNLSSECPACSSSNIHDFIGLNETRLVKYLSYSTDYYAGLFEKWLPELEPNISQCKLCRHYFYSEIPEAKALSVMYESLVSRPSSPDPRRKPSALMLSIMLKLRSKIDWTDSPTLLDFGAGYGRWSMAAKESGFKVTAFEPHMNRSSVSEGIDLASSIQELHDKVFDVVFLEQVLEHVSSPEQVLKDVKRCMHEKSILRVGVPNVGKAEVRSNIWQEWPYNGKKNHIMAPYQHLQGFNCQSLSALAKRLGFKELHSGGSIVHRCRRILGRFLPQISTTLLYLKIET